MFLDLQLRLHLFELLLELLSELLGLDFEVAINLFDYSFVRSVRCFILDHGEHLHQALASRGNLVEHFLLHFDLVKSVVVEESAV